MAVAPQYWQQARARAPIHVQIRLDKRPDPAEEDPFVAGPLVRIFRDTTGQLRLGGVVSFPVNWEDRSREPDPDRPIRIGKQSFPIDITWLRAAAFLEAYLEPAGGGLHVVWDQVTPLARATRRPVNPAGGEAYGVLTPDDVARQQSKRRFRFWPW